MSSPENASPSIIYYSPRMETNSMSKNRDTFLNKSCLQPLNVLFCSWSINNLWSHLKNQLRTILERVTADTAHQDSSAINKALPEQRVKKERDEPVSERESVGWWQWDEPKTLSIPIGEYLNQNPWDSHLFKPLSCYSIIRSSPNMHEQPRCSLAEWINKTLHPHNEWRENSYESHHHSLVSRGPYMQGWTIRLYGTEKFLLSSDVTAIRTAQCCVWLMYL